MAVEDTRRAIAEAAAQEFLLRGYAGASLSAIAERLGLTKGALSYHFRAKADFATDFIHVVRAATAQAETFAKAAYPTCGASRLVLYFMTMGAWRETEPRYAAGIALFGDNCTPEGGGRRCGWRLAHPVRRRARDHARPWRRDAHG